MATKFYKTGSKTRGTCLVNIIIKISTVRPKMRSLIVNFLLFDYFDFKKTYLQS